MLTAIVPVDLSQRALDIVKKAINMAHAAELAKVHIIFGHNNRNTIYDKMFLKSIAKFKSANIASENYYKLGVNTSLLRNKAFRKVTSEHLVLLDIDIWPDFKKLKKYSEKINNGSQPFYILPCLYLTKYGSKKLTTKKLSASDLIDRFYSFSRKEFLHLASPSSVTVMKSSDYENLGGFNINYNGHGYEDFDFLVRLSAYYNKLEPTTDFMVDKTARSPLFAEGFRRYLGELCLETLLEKDMVFHIYHDKPKGSKYYSSRPINFNFFAAQHTHLIGYKVSKDPTLLTNFVSLCIMKGQCIQDYAILFDNKPGHIDRFDTFKRRLRFLLNG
ncbi:galactosyltransferase-related protein [Yersinia mollaretii]|uniref:galactosyltransferase-related protein n=1 Tax=Yersinia mollaretii TaxID=33060 RepID=UPI0011A6DA01|nr:galactosyltransferase-related protein [Yersinia mollaretii]